MKLHRTTPHFLFALSAAVPSALAQDAPPAADEGGAPGAQPGINVVQVPGPTTTQVVVPGYPQPGFDPNGHLPSSARGSTDTSRPSDGFDLNRGSEGPSSVRGNQNGSYIVEGQFVPEAHSVRRGDTLWDISGRYYQNPYTWPQLWAMNPQIQNPHWIYPGDRVRLRDPSEGPTLNSIGAGSGLGGRKVPPQTIFLREVGWIDDHEEEPWGEIVGSPEDQMLLSDGDEVYIRLKEDDDNKRPVSIGQELQIFRPIKQVGEGKAKGDLVSVRGTVRVDRYNPKTRMVRAKIIESLDVVERGAMVAPVVRRFDVIPPVQSDKDVEARIIASVYPNHLYGHQQVVFLNKGSEEGVRPGQRFFAIRRGDRWVQTLPGAGSMATLRPRVEDERAAVVDQQKFGVDEDLLPDETYGELRVLKVRKHTCAALVTASTHEIERTAVLVSRKGY